jgi:succinate-semialdehyde dehydrogenase/glutarate-semialdehyde dehydrogenase
LQELKAITGNERGEILRRWYELVIAARDDLAMIIIAENGKTSAEARGEVTYAADFLNWFSAEAPRLHGTCRKRYRAHALLL